MTGNIFCSKLSTVFLVLGYVGACEGRGMLVGLQIIVLVFHGSTFLGLIFKLTIIYMKWIQKNNLLYLSVDHYGICKSEYLCVWTFSHFLCVNYLQCGTWTFLRCSHLCTYNSITGIYCCGHFTLM